MELSSVYTFHTYSTYSVYLNEASECTSAHDVTNTSLFAFKQVDLVAQGDSIYDIIDPSDHFVMRNQLALPSSLDSGKFLNWQNNRS